MVTEEQDKAFLASLAAEVTAWVEVGQFSGRLLSMDACTHSCVQDCWTWLFWDNMRHQLCDATSSAAAQPALSVNLHSIDCLRAAGCAGAGSHCAWIGWL